MSACTSAHSSCTGSDRVRRRPIRRVRSVRRCASCTSSRPTACCPSRRASRPSFTAGSPFTDENTPAIGRSWPGSAARSRNAATARRSRCACRAHRPSARSRWAAGTGCGSTPRGTCASSSITRSRTTATPCGSWRATSVAMSSRRACTFPPAAARCVAEDDAGAGTALPRVPYPWRIRRRPARRAAAKTASASAISRAPTNACCSVPARFAPAC